MPSKDDKELSEILKNRKSGKGGMVTPMANRRNRSKAVDEAELDEPESSEPSGKLIQWTTVDGGKFFPSGKTVGTLTPGLYEVGFSNSAGLYFSKLHFNTKGLLKFPDSKSASVIAEITKFWDRRKFFKNRKGRPDIAYKRGILLWGPPGSGKTCTIALTLKDVIDRGGIGLVFTEPDLFTKGARVLREIQELTKVVVLMEDLDAIISRYNESAVLNILDGVNSFEDVVFLGTTNYPDRLGERIINRPSRFDKRIKIGHPGAGARRMYFKKMLTPEEIKESNIDMVKWVKDTDGMSLAHLKELMVSVVMLGNPYDDALGGLKEMKENLSPEEDAGKKLGFTSSLGEDDD